MIALLALGAVTFLLVKHVEKRIAKHLRRQYWISLALILLLGVVTIAIHTIDNTSCGQVDLPADPQYYYNGEAVNKGFKMLKGEVVGWLNSDDVYFDTRVIARVVRCFNRRPDADIIYGDLALIDKNGLILKVDVAPGFSRRRLSRGVIIPQPAAFFRNHVVQRHDLDERLHYFMDHDFFLRLCADYNFYHFRSILAAQRHYPERKTLAHKEAMAAEYRQLLRKYNLGVGVTSKALRIWDRWCAGVPRRIDELIRILSLSSSYDFAFPARLDSRWARFKRLARIDTDKIVDKLADQSSLGDIRGPLPTEARSGEGRDHGGP